MYGRIAKGKGTDEIVVRTWVPSWTLVLGGDLVGARRVFCYFPRRKIWEYYGGDFSRLSMYTSRCFSFCRPRCNRQFITGVPVLVMPLPELTYSATARSSHDASGICSVCVRRCPFYFFPTGAFPFFFAEASAVDSFSLCKYSSLVASSFFTTSMISSFGIWGDIENCGSLDSAVDVLISGEEVWEGELV